MLLKPDGRITDFTKFRSRRVQKVEGIFFSPVIFSLTAARVPLHFFIHKVCFTNHKIHTDLTVVGLIFSQQSFLKAALSKTKT